MTWVILLIAVLCCTVFVRQLKKSHDDDRRRKRVCTYKNHPASQACGAETRRIYKMVDASDGRPSKRWSRFFRWFIIDKCEKHAVCVDRGLKEFQLHKLAWRHLHDPRQFNSDEKLFEEAGLLHDAVAPLATRIMEQAEESIQRRADRLGAACPPGEFPATRALKTSVSETARLLIARHGK